MYFVRGRTGGWKAFRTKQNGLPIYGPYSAMASELKRMEVVDRGNTTIPSVNNAGCKIAVPGTAESAGSVKTGLPGIVQDV